MPKFILKINSVDDTVYVDDDIVCFLADSSLPEEWLCGFERRGRLFLLSGDKALSLCKTVGADGVVAELKTDAPVKAQVAKIRSQLGAGKVLGTVIVPRRHEAMLISETEPEFVAFKFPQESAAPAAEVVKWYNDLFLIQSAVDLTDGLQDIAAFDPDFVIINSRDYKDFGC